MWIVILLLSLSLSCGSIASVLKAIDAPLSAVSGSSATSPRSSDGQSVREIITPTAAYVLVGCFSSGDSGVPLESGNEASGITTFTAQNCILACASAGLAGSPTVYAGIAPNSCWCANAISAAEPIDIALCGRDASCSYPLDDTCGGFQRAIYQLANQLEDEHSPISTSSPESFLDTSNPLAQHPNTLKLGPNIRSKGVNHATSTSLLSQFASDTQFNHFSKRDDVRAVSSLHDPQSPEELDIPLKISLSEPLSPSPPTKPRIPKPPPYDQTVARQWAAVHKPGAHTVHLFEQPKLYQELADETEDTRRQRAKLRESVEDRLRRAARLAEAKHSFSGT